MRFEMKADDVMSLLRLIYGNMEQLHDKSSENWFQLKRIELIAKKIKIYGAEAFSSRELYRSEMLTLKETIEAAKKRIGMS